MMVVVLEFFFLGCDGFDWEFFWVCLLFLKNIKNKKKEEDNKISRTNVKKTHVPHLTFFIKPNGRDQKI